MAARGVDGRWGCRCNDDAAADATTPLPRASGPPGAQSMAVSAARLPSLLSSPLAPNAQNTLVSALEPTGPTNSDRHRSNCYSFNRPPSASIIATRRPVSTRQSSSFRQFESPRLARTRPRHTHPRPVHPSRRHRRHRRHRRQRACPRPSRTAAVSVRPVCALPPLSLCPSAVVVVMPGIGLRLRRVCSGIRPRRPPAPSAEIGLLRANQVSCPTLRRARRAPLRAVETTAQPSARSIEIAGKHTPLARVARTQLEAPAHPSPSKVLSAAPPLRGR